MLSFIFVIVCGLFEWKLICIGFIFRLFINVLPLEIPLTGLTPPHVYACLKPGPEIPTSYDLFCAKWAQWRWKVIVRFVDIGGTA